MRNRPSIHFVYAGDPENDRAIRAPGTICNRLYRFLQAHSEVQFHDWADRDTHVTLGEHDIVLGHPHPQPGTMLRRLWPQPCRAKFLLFPFHSNLPAIARFVLDLAINADRLLLISGPFWIDSIAQTEFAAWAGRISRIDNAVDGAFFSMRKKAFNAVGQRGYFLLGRSGEEKGTRRLFEQLAAIPGHAVVAGWYTPDDLALLKQRPDTEHIGEFDWGNARQVSHVMQHCDFFLNMSYSDASPTALLECMASGLIPVTTPECGYTYDSFYFLSHTAPEANRLLLQGLQMVANEELALRQRQNRALIETHHQWEQFCASVWTALIAVAGDQ